MQLCIAYQGLAVSHPASATDLESDMRRFAPEDVAFALAWEVYAPGLGGWTVQMDEDEDGTEFLLVDPPLVYGDGFTVRREGAGASITWAEGAAKAESVRAAMLTICPLSPDALVAVEHLAAAPAPEF
jgi:hypothetical protein